MNKSTYKTLGFSSKVFGEPNWGPVDPAPECEGQTRVAEGEGKHQDILVDSHP